MNANRLQNTITELAKMKKIALLIIKELESEDLYDKLDTLDRLNRLPELPTDSVSCELKEYKETRDIYKRLYTIAARSIMQVLNSNFFLGAHDPSHSFNYSDPREPVRAAEKIQYLPKAYMGGPIRAAVTSPYPMVNKMAVEFYDELPQEMKFSSTFPDEVRKKIRNIRGK